MKTLSTKKLCIACCAIVLMGSCSKSSIVYDFEKYPDNNESSGNNGSQTLVTFNATIEGRNMTRAMSPMNRGVQSQLYAFDPSKSSSVDSPTTEGLYVTIVPGVLRGVDGYKMYLNNGTYNFYAVSDNTPDAPPTFTAGKSEKLSNGIDYLWWKGAQHDIASSLVSIPIVFLHSATQVVFEIAPGEGINLDQLVSATITPSKAGSSMYLSTGEIPPIDEYDSPVQMGINGFTAQYIMLPLETAEPMTLTLEIKVEEETVSRTYTVDVPVPDGKLQAGNSYLFKAVIDGNRVIFPNVSVRAWTEVDETGKPLYPTQSN